MYFKPFGAGYNNQTAQCFRKMKSVSIGIIALMLFVMIDENACESIDKSMKLPLQREFMLPSIIERKFYLNHIYFQAFTFLITRAHHLVYS